MRNIKKQTVMLLLTALCVTASALSVRAQINIFHDFDEALAAASESGKPVMIDFYFDT